MILTVINVGSVFTSEAVFDDLHGLQIGNIVGRHIAVSFVYYGSWAFYTQFFAYDFKPLHQGQIASKPSKFYAFVRREEADGVKAFFGGDGGVGARP